MSPRKRRPVPEKEYRERLWAEVARALDVSEKNKAALSRDWGKSKSTVQRLEEQYLPTTLGNIDDLAAALGMELGELLWPVVQPTDPAAAEKRGNSRALRAQTAFFDSQMRRYLSALKSNDSRAVLRLIGRLGIVAPDDLPTVIAQLEGLVQFRERERPTRWPVESNNT